METDLGVRGVIDGEVCPREGGQRMRRAIFQIEVAGTGIADVSD
jgi:hypothetical protein